MTANISTPSRAGNPGTLTMTKAHHISVSIERHFYSSVHVSVTRDGEPVHSDNFDLGAVYVGLEYVSPTTALFYHLQSVLVGCARRCWDTPDRFFTHKAAELVNAYSETGKAQLAFTTPES